MSRQENLVRTAIKQTIENNAVAQQAHNEDGVTTKRKDLSVFVADTDSIRFIVDTGTNKMIVNDIKEKTCFMAEDT